MTRQMAAIFAPRQVPPPPVQAGLPTPCELCGHVGTYGRPVHGGEVFPFPAPLRNRTSTGSTWETYVRCNDRQACRDRFEDANPDEVWPIDDGTTRTAILLTTPAGTAYAASLPSVSTEPAVVESGAENPESEWEGF